MFTPRSAYERMQEREDRAREIFDEFDTNRDGVLDFDELNGMLEALNLGDDGTELGKQRKRKLVQEYKAMDEDGSGEIDFPEFVRYYNKMLAYQQGAAHSHAEGGSATDLWGEGGIEKMTKLADKLQRKRKLTDDEHEQLTFMIKSRYLMMDLKVAVMTYKRAESLVPLKRLLRKTKEDVKHRMSLNERFWSMTPAHIQRCSDKSDQLFQNGIISYAEKTKIQSFLADRLHLTELKAAFVSVFEHDDVKLLKTVLQAKSAATGVAIQVNTAQLSGAGRTVRLAHEAETGQTSTSTAGSLDYHFELSEKTIDGHDVVTLSHAQHSKGKYAALCKAADLFYGTANRGAPVQFDGEVLQKILHVIDMLVKRGFLTHELGNKAREFVIKGDKYCVYALYKYDVHFDSLETYLRFKMSDQELEVRRSKQDRVRQTKQASVDSFMQERREVLAIAQQRHGKGVALRKAYYAGVKAEVEAAAGAGATQESEQDDEQANDDDARARKNSQHHPRWLLLYQSKFQSYSKLLHDEEEGDTGQKT